MNQDNDFGFTFASETNMIEKSKEIKKLIMPFLLRLTQNPDKDIIHWKGELRVKQIQEIIDKINSIEPN
jgi:hypothetical protein